MDIVAGFDAPVTDRAHISHLLMRLIETRVPLTIRVSGRKQMPSTTALLRIDLKREVLELDEPLPALKNLEAGQNLRISGRVDGTTVDFQAPLKKVERERNIETLVAALPREVIHRERRDNFRVQIPKGLTLPPAMLAQDKDAFRGRLLDISVSGAGCLIPADRALAIGAELNCTFSVLEARLIVTAVVCSIVPSATAGMRRVGLRFKELTVSQKDAIVRAIAGLDRHMLRRHADTAIRA